MGERGKMMRLLLAYLVIWLLSVGVFWILIDGSDALGYGIIFVWLLNPAAAFVVSFLMGKGVSGGKVLVAPVAFGLMCMLLPYLTFSLANTLSSGNLNAPEVEMFVVGAAMSALGLGFGRLANSIARRGAERGRTRQR